MEKILSEEKKPLISVRDLNVEFSTGKGKQKRVTKAVKNSSFDIFPGERVAIVGESGSGKSTTAHALINLLPGSGKITSGSIKWYGDSGNSDSIELVGAPESEFIKLRGSGIGLVPQDPMSNLNPVWKVGFQVRETLQANGAKDKDGNLLKGKALEKEAAHVLELAGLDDAKKRMKQYPHEFSGGMCQRVLIGIGLANKPQMLIADEPTSALDVTVQKIILDHLNELTTELGSAMLFITHDLGLAAERSDRLIVMYKGQIVESGPSLEILKNPQHDYTKKLIQAAPSLASVRLQSTKAAVVGMIDKPLPEHFEIAHEQNLPDFSTDNMIEVYDVTKEFTVRGQKEKLKAVDAVTFSVEKGKTTAIVGESGSGKSTVANMILGLLKPTYGEIAFKGQYLKEWQKNRKSEKNFRSRVQPVFQNPYGSLDPMASIGRSIREPLDIHKIGDKKSREKKVLELLDMVQLPSAVANRYPNELSGGQRQRIAVARALALHPEMMVLDEAVSALDVLVQEQILTLLNDLQAELGLTYLFITHDLAVVRLIADGTIVMQKGQIVERGATEDVFNHPQKEYTQNLLDAIPGRHLF
ncbi:MAG: ABC transporter ATP-binding protein [Candidatus Ancillula sp.]|jgi:peptide/nickel transport system ATP-binding protein|nr:ABC transporter ATP-binding protein [Candidatus Ancillula sp.]